MLADALDAAVLHVHVPVQQVARARPLEQRPKRLEAAVRKVVEVAVAARRGVGHQQVHAPRRAGEKCHPRGTAPHLGLGEAVHLGVVADRPAEPHDAQPAGVDHAPVYGHAALGGVPVVGGVVVALHVEQRHVGQGHDVLEVGGRQVAARHDQVDARHALGVPVVVEPALLHVRDGKDPHAKPPSAPCP